MTEYELIRDEIVRNGDVLTISMERLRLAHGAGKLGVNVSAGIQRELKNQGLGYLPSPLPTYSGDQVRLYRVGSPVGTIIDAALNLGTTNDAYLREAGNNESARMIEKIRELVCD